MRCRTRIAALTLLAGALGFPSYLVATQEGPFVPTEDGEVLERLPAEVFDGEARRLRELHRRLTAQPNDLGLALYVSRHYLAKAKGTSDPRYYGYAQGALAPWWDEPSPPAAVLVLRATIRQHNHEFIAARADLESALRTDSDSTEAWLTHAIVLQVLGEYAAAEHSCDEVRRLSTPLVAMTCLSGVGSLMGRAAQSYDRLREVAAQSPNDDTAVQLWAQTTLAEISQRRGLAPLAEEHFQKALAQAPADPYLNAAYADFLLDVGRPGEVISRLRQAARLDALLLRLALAEDALGAPERAAHVEILQDRFAAARRRGDVVHRREEARFALQLLHQPRAALQLAQANWQTQREPADARILLESALAAGEPSAAAPVVDFLTHNATEDQVLARLMQRLAEGGAVAAPFAK